MHATSCRPLEDGAEITSPKLAKLFTYWSAKAQGRFAPTRGDINPADIPRLLPWVWLIDVIDGGTDFRFRIGGEKLIDFIGHRMAGETIGAHRQRPFFGSVAQAFAQCVSEKKPLLRPHAATRYEPRRSIETEALVLPLSDNGTDVSQIFGGFVTTTPMARLQELANAPG
jgi:hypothetical protein